MNRIGVASIRALPGYREGVPGFARQPALPHPGALVTIYIVLGVLYESYVHPLTILSTLPQPASAPLGADGVPNDFSIMALIGVILLIGIVKKNAIMMIDFALEAERRRG